MHEPNLKRHVEECLTGKGSRRINALDTVAVKLDKKDEEIVPANLAKSSDDSCKIGSSVRDIDYW